MRYGYSQEQGSSYLGDATPRPIVCVCGAVLQMCSGRRPAAHPACAALCVDVSSAFRYDAPEDRGRVCASDGCTQPFNALSGIAGLASPCKPGVPGRYGKAEAPPDYGHDRLCNALSLQLAPICTPLPSRRAAVQRSKIEDSYHFGSWLAVRGSGMLGRFSPRSELHGRTRGLRPWCDAPAAVLRERKSQTHAVAHLPLIRSRRSTRQTRILRAQRSDESPGWVQRPVRHQQRDRPGGSAAGSWPPDDNFPRSCRREHLA